jgi:HEAT repeat protein
MLLLALALQAADPFPKLAADRDPDRRVQAIDSLRGAPDLQRVQFLAPLLADEHPKVRFRAVRALQDLSDPAALQAFLRTAFRHPSPRAREAACEAAASFPDLTFTHALFERLGDPDPQVQGAAARALARRPDPSIPPLIVQAFRRDSDWPVRAHALDSSAAPELLEEAAADRNPQVRLSAAEACGRLHLDTPLTALVADRDWRVRAAAVQASREVRTRPLIGALVDQLGRETGRLRWDVLRALHDLTGNDLGLDGRPWQAWWSAQRETFAPRPKGGKGGPDLGGTQASFFKVPILSARLLFVLDLSGSMREPDPAGGTKLDAARKGMLETIQALPPGTRFGIVGLGCDEDGRPLQPERKCWQGRPVLVPASPAAKADAARFVRSLEARGWTNLYDGLLMAFQDPDVDTIYLYSDGGASKGTFVAAGEILEHLRRANRFRRIAIHAVEIPGLKNPADNRRLLSDVARENWGEARLYEKERGR